MIVLLLLMSVSLFATDFNESAVFMSDNFSSGFELIAERAVLKYEFMDDIVYEINMQCGFFMLYAYIAEAEPDIGIQALENIVTKDVVFDILVLQELEIYDIPVDWYEVIIECERLLNIKEIGHDGTDLSPA